MCPKFSWDDFDDAPSRQDQSAGKFSWDDYQDASEHGVGSYIKDAAKSTVDALPMVGGVVGGIVGTPLDLAGIPGTIIGAGAGGGLGVAVKNAINAKFFPSDAPKNYLDALSQPVVGGLEQAAMHGAGDAVAPYVEKGVGYLAKTVPAKAASFIGGVKAPVISEYLQNSSRINSQPTLEQLKDVSDNYVGNLLDQVNQKKISLDQAKDAFTQFQNDLKDTYKTAGYDARDAVTSAQQTLKDAHNARLQQLSGDVYNTINKLKSEVQSGSSNALGVLDKANAVIDLRPTYSQIDDTISSLTKKGTDESLSIADKLQAWKDRQMSTHGIKVSPPDAKQLIQGIDQITEYSPMAGAFDKAKNSAFKGIRSTLDQTVKSTVPEYAQAMEPVAQNADLLNRVQETFGDKASGVSALQRINAPNQFENKAALDQLGKKYGVDFVSAAQPENLPEQQLLNSSNAKLDSLRPDRVSEKIDQTLSASRQKSALDQAQSDYQSAQNELAPFKSLAPNAAGQTQAQQKLAQLGKGNNIELTDMFQRLGKLTGTDFVQAMKDQNTLAAFQRGATNGSRNTLMGAIVGWLFGHPVYGAAAGRAVDEWGPAVTKKALDLAITIGNKPSVTAIMNSDLPAAVKQNMVIGLKSYLANQSGQSGEMVPAGAAQQDQSPAKPSLGPDKWAQSGIKNLGIQDQDLTSRLLSDPKGKQLLRNASIYSPGSKPLKNIMYQIQKGWGQG